MDNFTAHLLRFVTEAQSTLELNEHQGSASGLSFATRLASGSSLV